MRPVPAIGLTLLVLVTACVATIASALAQNTVTAPSNTSRSGVQSVITQTRDSLQRRKPTGQQPQLRQRRSGTKDQAGHSSDH